MLHGVLFFAFLPGVFYSWTISNFYISWQVPLNFLITFVQDAKSLQTFSRFWTCFEEKVILILRIYSRDSSKPYPVSPTKPNKLAKKIFCYRWCKPSVFEDKPYELGFMISPLRMFRSSPTINNEAYINWSNKVEKKKEQIWESQGIYHLIQLSRTGPKYNTNMLISSLYFWEGSTNTFQLCCGMITPYFSMRLLLLAFDQLGIPLTLLSKAKANPNFLLPV